jgi:hypothetical protein
VATDWRGRSEAPERRRSMACAATPALHAALLNEIQPLVPWLDSPLFDRV